MTAPQDLLANPLKFMKNNIVLVTYEGSKSDKAGGSMSIANGAKTFKLYTNPNISAKMHGRGGKKINIYVLVPQGPGVHPNYVDVDPNTPITAFFCPFGADATYGTTLDNQSASLMFTTQMDGCTFGIGNATGNSVLVFHSNEAGVGGKSGRAAQAQAQDAALQTAFGNQGVGIASTLSPVGAHNYKTSSKGTEYQATTFGIRTGTQWSFYSQRYTIERGVPRQYGLKEVMAV